MISPLSIRSLIVIALLPSSCLSTCPNHALLGCVLRLKAQRVPFEKNMMNVVFNIATEAKLLRTCRVYSNTMPCFREKIVECGDDKQKRMLDEVGRMLMFICSPFSLQRQRHLIKHQRCISAVLNLPPTTDCPIEDQTYLRDLSQCRKNCADQSSNFLCTMQTWMSEQNVCTMQSLQQKCGEEAAGLYDQMQVTVFEPHFPIICDRVARSTLPPLTTTKKSTTATSKAPTTYPTTSSSVVSTKPASRAKTTSAQVLPSTTAAIIKEDTTTVEPVMENVTDNSIVNLLQRPAKNRTIADLWEVYAASSDKYHKKLSELWKNKKLGILIDSASNGSLLHSTTMTTSMATTTVPPLPSTERTTTSTEPSTTSAVSPRTIKVINILRRLLPDYMPQLSSLFEHGNDLLMLGTTPPLPSTTSIPTTYFAKKSSFKRPSSSPLDPVYVPTATPTNQRSVHRMAPRMEHLQSSTSSPLAIPSEASSLSTMQPTSVPTSYAPQFPIASFDPNSNSRMLRLPDAIFATGIKGTTTSSVGSNPSSIPSKSMTESISSTNYRISYLPTGGTTTTPPTKLNLSSAGSFPEFIKSLANLRPIPAKEMTQKFLAYPPSNPKFIFAAPRQNDGGIQSTSSSSQHLISENTNSEERVVRGVEKWKPWYLGSDRRN